MAMPGVNPGFPLGGGTSFPINCMKLRNFWSHGGRPLDVPMYAVYFLKIHNFLLMFLILAKSTRCTLYTDGSLRLIGILVSILLLLYRANLEMVIF